MFRSITRLPKHFETDFAEIPLVTIFKSSFRNHQFIGCLHYPINNEWPSYWAKNVPLVWPKDNPRR